MRAEVPIGASREDVWDALTDPRRLEQWFCEHADVDLEAGRYDFWGRYTPDVPDRDTGRHELIEVVDGERLRYRWPIRGLDTVVDLSLEDAGEETIVRLVHENCPEPSETGTDVPAFWSLVLRHGLRALTEFGVVGAGRFDFTLPTVFDDRTVVSVDIDASREHVYGVLVADLDRQWWVSTRAGEIAYDPPGEVSTPFVMDGYAVSVLTWTLEESGGGTRVTLVHSGFGPGEKGNIRGAMGWTDSLWWLKFLSEFGRRWLERQERAVIVYSSGSTPVDPR